MLRFSIIFSHILTGSYSNEGVRIDKVQEGKMINSKNEWNYFHVPRTIIAHDSAIVKFKFSHIGLHDTRKHANYFNVSYMNY